MSEFTIKEKDKPFILALIFVIGMFALMFTGVAVAFYNAELVLDYMREIITSVVTIVGMITVFYFTTKANNK